jgi:hypothetical protein
MSSWQRHGSFYRFFGSCSECLIEYSESIAQKTVVDDKEFLILANVGGDNFAAQGSGKTD